jgi:hypothetical protein
MYSLQEIFSLFGLSSNITIEDLKRAKKQVLMTHPDKSKLSPDYFLFYKKAFDIVVQFYDNQNKTNQQVPTEKQDYKPMNQNDFNKSTNVNIQNKINKMTEREFQSKFNQLFEQNVESKINTSRNEWFSKDEPVYNVQETVNTKNMQVIFDQIKEKQSSMALSEYRGVTNLPVNMNSGSQLYEDDDSQSKYLECDPFSKLKFDDLRKVHKDQTVFSVSERDFQKVKQYSSVDHFVRERGQNMQGPLEKEQAEKILSMQEQQYRERMMQKEHAAKLQSMQYKEKNKRFISSFLQVKN